MTDEQKIRCDDINVYYEQHGDRNKPPLVLIHGLGSSTEDWENQVDALGEHYHVITYDLRGHGRTDITKGPYSIEQFSTDLANLIKALHLGPCHVAGLSLGGSIALQTALIFPRVTRSITVVNSGPELLLKTRKLKFQFFMRKAIVTVAGMRRMGKVLADKLLPEAGQVELHKKMVDRWARNDRRAYLDSLNALIGWSVTQCLPQIRCPTLILTADNDYTPVGYKQYYAKMIPNSEVRVIENSRHMSPFDQPQAFNTELLAFLDKHSQAG